jgi:hypothetical protein
MRIKKLRFFKKKKNNFFKIQLYEYNFLIIILYE